jgi:glycosyltransferase involved in cell wall biosynthesis
MGKIKVLHFITGLDVGGAENLLLSFCKNLKSEKYQIDVCYLKGNGTLKEKFEEMGIRVFDLTKSKFLLTRIIKFYKLLKTNRYGILHLHLFHSIIIGRFLGRLAKIPQIITSEHNTSNFKKNILILWLYRFTLSFNSQIIAISEAVKNIIVSKTRISPDRISVVYDAIDFSEFDCNSGTEDIKTALNIRGRSPVVGSIGRLDIRKGYKYLIAALPDLIKRYPSIVLVIVGEGEQREELMQEAARHNVQPYIIFTGYQSGISKYLAIFDVFVLPSLEEGLSISIIEAMAMKKKIAASDTGGIPELIEDGKEGVLFPKGNPSAIVNAVEFILNNKKKADAMSEAAYSKAISNYGIATYCDTICKLYDNVLN